MGWIDHFDYYGPIYDFRLLEEPKFLTTAIVTVQSEEGFQHAVSGWAKFGNPTVVEAVYAYVTQVKRGVLDKGALVQKLLPLFPKLEEWDVLALQRVLKLALGVTTCDLGVAVLTHIPVGDAPPPALPLTTIFQLQRANSTIYIARNNAGTRVYDLETMCVIPMSSRGPPHPLYRAYVEGYQISTETPGERDLCVVHRRLKTRCVPFY